MENTSRTSLHALTGRKVIQTAILIAFAGLVCRTPLAGEFFPAAAAVTAYMVSRKPQYIYLMLPIAAGILPYYTRGYDIWCDLISMSVCGLFFAAAHRIGFRLWHKALTAAAITIICTCIYRMATLTIYKTDVQTLVFEGFLVFAMVFLTDGFCRSIAGRQSTKNTEIQITALAAASLGDTDSRSRSRMPPDRLRSGAVISSVAGSSIRESLGRGISAVRTSSLHSHSSRNYSSSGRTATVGVPDDHHHRTVCGVVM